jgi:hypothetical protein
MPIQIQTSSRSSWSFVVSGNPPSSSWTCSLVGSGPSNARRRNLGHPLSSADNLRNGLWGHSPIGLMISSILPLSSRVIFFDAPRAWTEGKISEGLPLIARRIDRMRVPPWEQFLAIHLFKQPAGIERKISNRSAIVSGRSRALRGSMNRPAFTNRFDWEDDRALVHGCCSSSRKQIGRCTVNRKQGTVTGWRGSWCGMRDADDEYPGGVMIGKTK